MTNPMFPPPYSLGQCIERMPLHARTRFEDLKAMVSDAQALVNTLQERFTAAQDEYALIQRRHARAVTLGDADEAKKLQRELEAISGKASKLERERSRRNSVAANTGQIVSRLESFIEAVYMQVPSSITLPPQITVTPQLHAGESVSAAVTRLRNEIGKVRGELAMVHAAPLPANEVRAALVAEIDRMAMEGRPRISVTGTRAMVCWPDTQEFSVPGQSLSAPSGGASKLMAWLHRDEIIARLTGNMVDNVAGAIPTAERPRRIQNLERKLFALEVEEEHWVAEALSSGLEVHRRVDASPWPILGWGLQAEALVAEAAE